LDRNAHQNIHDKKKRDNSLGDAPNSFKNAVKKGNVAPAPAPAPAPEKASSTNKKINGMEVADAKREQAQPMMRERSRFGAPLKKNSDAEKLVRTSALLGIDYR
jgi:hypothetical protein